MRLAWKQIILWGLVICWMMLIFSFSHQPAVQSSQMSSSVTERFIELIPSIRTLPLEERLMVIEQCETIIRKLAHAFVYFMLAVFSFFAANEEKSLAKWRVWLLALAICLVYAISDEWHQAFIVGRSCEARDVIIDFLGATLGSTFLLIIYKITNHKKYKLDKD